MHFEVRNKLELSNAFEEVSWSANGCGSAGCWLISCELKLIRDAVIDEMIVRGQGDGSSRRGLT